METKHPPAELSVLFTFIREFNWNTTFTVKCISVLQKSFLYFISYLKLMEATNGSGAALQFNCLEASLMFLEINDPLEAEVMGFLNDFKYG